MINPTHLRSLIAIADEGSFSAAGTLAGRSHSAISLHIKALEDALGTQLLDRSTRPVSLTSDGLALVDQARRLEQVMDDIRMIGQSDRIVGQLRVGFVPSALSHLAPPALSALQIRQPQITVQIRSGLSGDLAHAVTSGDLDAAIVTGPDLALEGLVEDRITSEPLAVIAPGRIPAGSDRDLLTSHPFIWFSRKTWAGQQIERRLLDRRIRIRETMEVDSLEAIEALVRNGLGVSIVPDRWHGQHPKGLQVVPFGDPPSERTLVLLRKDGSAKARLIRILTETLMETCEGQTVLRPGK